MKLYHLKAGRKRWGQEQKKCLNHETSDGYRKLYHPDICTSALLQGDNYL